MSNIFEDYSFGGWLKRFRLEQGYTLRECASLFNMDAGNLSKLERSEMAPPKCGKKITAMCEILGKTESVPLMKSIAFQHHLANLRKEFFE